ncbi:MAG TPA: DUF2934 domain-containing protein, partial [Blastocatellia bacterium]
MNTELDKDSMERLRENLLADEEVRVLISMRAYEIYINRGAAPGREADDWFQAESEILPILINEELNKRNGGYIPQKPKAAKSRKKTKDLATETATVIVVSEFEALAPVELTYGHGKKSAKANSTESKKKAASKVKVPAEVAARTMVANAAGPEVKAAEKDSKVAKETKARAKVAKASKGAEKEVKPAKEI